MENAAQFEILDLGITYAATSEVWVSALSRIGAVHGVPVGVEGAAPPGGFDLSPGGLRECVEQFRRAVEFGRRDPDLGRAIARVLGELAFRVEEVRALLQRTRGVAADRGCSLVVRVQAAPQSLADLPWELLPDPEAGPNRYLTLAPNTHVARLARVRTYTVRAEPLPPPLRLLLILSSPPLGDDADAPSFDVYEEKRNLLAELQPLVDAGLLEVDVEDRPTLENLRHRVIQRQRGYHLVHYTGHARPDAVRLEAGRGRGEWVPRDAFNDLLRSCPQLRLVFFAGCETAQAPAATDPGRWRDALSLADLCVRDACPVVVGMQARLPFPAERLFTRFFYRGLAGGRSVAEALSLARAAAHDDPHAGRGQLAWAVPSLFFGGEPPGRLLDGRPPPPPAPRRPREQLKIDVDEGEREFFARHIDLRTAVDFLTGRTPGKRVLWICEPVGGEKTRLIDRALEDVGEAIDYLLFVPVGHLLGKPDPVLYLCGLVAELLGRRDGKARRKQDDWGPADWWVRLVDEVVCKPFAVVLDASRAASPADLERLAAALRTLAQRQNARLVVLNPPTHDPPPWDGLAGRVELVKLKPYDPDDVLRWVGRNRPALLDGRFDSPALAAKFRELGPHLEHWSALAEEADLDRNAKISMLVEKALRRAGAGPISGGPEAKTPPGGLAPLRVACAGPDIEGRQKEFADALTVQAGLHGVGGRVVGAAAGDVSAGLGRLLDLPSPFADRKTAPDGKVLGWLNEALGAMADVVLLDFASAGANTVVDLLWRRVARAAAAQGVLVLGCGSAAPVYPGWLPEVLAAGPARDGRVAPGTHWDPGAGKPDLFAPESVAGTPLASVVHDPQRQGPALAALHVLTAAVLVWATDRRLRADDVRAILVGTAREMPTPEGVPGPAPRELDVEAALRRARTRFVLEALAAGPLGVDGLVSACPFPTGVTVRLVDRLVEENTLVKAVGAAGEHYSLRGQAEGGPAPA